MLLRHFNLREQPFGVSPDSRFLYASATHREALASMLYGIGSGLGFVALIAKPGMGKTTLLFEVLRRIEETARTVFLFQTISTPDDLFRALLIDLGAEDAQGSLVEMQSQLNEILAAQSATGKRLVVAIDEAQNLSESVLEALRMLSNFETSRQKLIQIILSGQPQLAEKLALPQLLQLRQRISIFAHLEPFSDQETAAYIEHRLQFCGNDSTGPIFSDSAMSMIAKHSEGIPRNINNLCFNALSLGCALQRTKIDSNVIDEVLEDSQFTDPSSTAIASKYASNRTKQAVIRNFFTSTFRSKVGARSLLTVACTLVFMLAWLALRERRAISSVASVQASSGATETPAINLTPLSGRANSILSQKTKIIRVKRGQSLTQICIETYGECSANNLRQIIKVNPAIRDPDYVESGQRVAIPIALPAQ
jgi:general secretion pathway protein A